MVMRAARRLVGGRWGAAPNPGRGVTPLHPAIWGFAPKDSRVWWCRPALALSSHLGLRPKPRARGLGMDKKRICGERQGRGVCARCGPSAYWKTCEMWEEPATLRSFISINHEAPRQEARVGFWGVAPNGYAKQKQGTAHKHFVLWGEAPITGCRGLSPLPGRGAEPHIVPRAEIPGPVEGVPPSSRRLPYTS